MAPLPLRLVHRATAATTGRLSAQFTGDYRVLAPESPKICLKVVCISFIGGGNLARLTLQMRCHRFNTCIFYPFEVATKNNSSKNSQLRHFLGKAEDAATCGYEAWIVQSTGEKVVVALAPNRADLLGKLSWIIPEAIERTYDWIPLVQIAERSLKDKGLIYKSADDRHTRNA